MANPAECYPYSIERHDSIGARLFNEVYHVCHRKEALRILGDGKLRSAPIANGLLKQSRIRVCYLSANDYGAVDYGSGSAFGYIRFCFDWSRVIAGRKLYWIEPFTPKSYRILLTDTRHRQLSRLNVKRCSPVIHDAKRNKWYWDCRSGSQFLVEADLSVRSCVRVDFVIHDAERCTGNPRCEPPAESRYAEGAKLLAELLSDKSSPDHSRLFTTRNSFHESALKAWKHLLRNLSRSRCKGTLRANDKRTRRLIREALGQYAANRPKTARKLCGQFRNTDELRKALNSLAAQTFDIAVERLRSESEN